MTSDERIAHLFGRIVSDPQLRGDSANTLAFGFDPDCESHFRPVRRARLTREEMFAGAAVDELDMLARLWSDSERSLKALIPDLREISEALAEERGAADCENPGPQDYIYRMW